MRMRLAVVLVLLSICLLVATGAIGARAAITPPSSPIGPALAAILNALPAGQQTSVIVILKDQANLSAIGGSTRVEHQKNVILALQQTANGAQGHLRTLLGQRLSQATVKSFRPLWIFDAIAVTATAPVIQELAAQPEVSQIVPDATIKAPSAPHLAAAVPSGPPAPNISLINAPALWNLGYQGQGIVVASMDTGVDAADADLSAQWRGGTDSWYDPYGQHSTPVDLNGHGTWTMGVMVGRDGSGTSIGVAPQAQWIAVKIFDDSGNATTSAIHLGYQWLLDPSGNPSAPGAPNVVNNSWTFSNVNGCDLTFEPDLQSLAAAGIVSVFAAGNFGPNGSTSVSPSNNPDAFAVGGVDNSDANDPESSRGPTSCGTASRTFPDVVAPDVNIMTTDLGGLYTTVTGTSVAAPHVTGGLALLLSAFPNLTASQQRIALTSSAVDLGVAGPDNTFGSGRIDLLAAYQLVASGALPTPTPAPTPTSTPTPAPTPTATPIPTPTSTPTPPNIIFADGFESGNFASWSAIGGTAARLSVTTTAAQAGTYGMQASVSSGTSGYVQDNSPTAETSYHARFYFNPHSATMTTTPLSLFVGLNGSNGTVFTVRLRKQSGLYQVSALVTRANSATNTTVWYTVSGTTFTAIEIAWQSGTSASFSLYTGGTLRQTLTGLNTSAQLLETVRMGPQGSLSGVSGTMYFDSFVSTRYAVIGV